MILSKIESWDDIKDVIRTCFSGDDDLINKYHIKAGTSLDQCVDDTFNVLLVQTHDDFEFYTVLDENEVVGFIGVEPDYLTTFCLKKEKRSQENKRELWSLITGLRENFTCGLYAKNKRAINYLLECGCEVKHEGMYEEHPIVVLNFKKEVLCHLED